MMKILLHANYMIHLHSHYSFHRATDLDSPKFAAVRYGFATGGSTSATTAGSFSLDPSTGEVTALAPFDAESSSAFELVVRAWNPGREDDAGGQATLVVSVAGENEFVPRFTQPVFQFAVSESAAAGAAVGRVEAEDGDAGVRDGEVSGFCLNCDKDEF